MIGRQLTEAWIERLRAKKQFPWLDRAPRGSR